MTQDEKIFTLEKELACATGQSTSDDHKDSASEKGSSNSEESKLLNRLKDQNLKLLSKIDKLRVKNQEVRWFEYF
jgi:hypothetical protein